MGDTTNPYKVEYAKSGRATCNGPCKRLIAKGELRLGSPMVFGEGVSYKWRHWGCITDLVLNNMRGKIERHGIDSALAGLEALRPEDRQRVQRWLDEGPLKEEPEQQEEEEETSEEEEAEEQEEEPAPSPVKTPKKRAPAPARASKRAAAKRREGGDDEEDEDYEPKAKRKATKRTRK